jgi:hypothetical protein
MKISVTYFIEQCAFLVSAIDSNLGMLCFKQTVESEGFFCHFGFPLIVGSFWCVIPIPVNMLQKQKWHYCLLSMPYCTYIGFVA